MRGSRGPPVMAARRSDCRPAQVTTARPRIVVPDASTRQIEFRAPEPVHPTAGEDRPAAPGQLVR